MNMNNTKTNGTNNNTAIDLQAQNRALLAELEALKTANAKAKADLDAKRVLSFKVSEKGCVSVYGLGRFPVTLYKGQWNKLLSKTAELSKFIADNNSLLREKE